VLAVVVLVAVAAGGCSGGNEAGPPTTAASTTSAGTTAAPTEPTPVESALPGADAYPICAAGGDYWPTMVLAVSGPTAWIACKEESRLVEFDLASGTEGRSVELFGTPIAVANGFGSVWALDSFGTLTRLAPSSAEVEAEIEVGSSAPYNIWMGAGSVWVADDAGGEVIRVDPVTNEVVTRIPVGDGPASMAFSGGKAWVANHRDRGITVIDTETNDATPLVRMKAGAPERLALLDGRLWVTGRGIGLFGLDPATGDVEKVVEVGASGIDLVAADGALWVPSRSAEIDPTGLPTMEALRRVTPAGKTTVAARPSAPLDVHGLAAGDGAVWLADTTSGVLYRVPTS
jgi:streptogramin lyase